MRILVVMAALLLVIAPAARAADAHVPNLDVAAASVAGHPVQVYCENDWQEWISWGQPQWESFTNPARDNVIYVSPRICEALTALSGRQDVGAYYASSALLALAHEAEHQAGLVNEGQTDCAALGKVSQLAVQFFGIPAKVPVKHYKVVRGKLHVTTTLIANPWLTKLAQDALRWHRQKPPEYQGGC